MHIEKTKPCTFAQSSKQQVALVICTSGKSHNVNAAKKFVESVNDGYSNGFVIEI